MGATMRFQLSIFKATLIFGLVTGLCLISMFAVSTFALKELRVGGPLYGQIKLGNDLVADVLPPPEYVVEAYLEATLAMRRPDETGAHKTRLAQLHKDYSDRYDFWIKSDLDPSLKTKLTVDSNAKVQDFWTVAEQQLIPALERSDRAAAEQAYLQLEKAYEAHRAIIDAIVADATAMNTRLEASADQRVSGFTTLVLIVFGVSVTIIALGIIGIAAGVVRPTVRMTDVMRRLAAGEIEVTIPSRERTDEIGDMAKAVAVFKDQAVIGRAQAEREKRSEAVAAEARKQAIQEMASKVERETSGAIASVETTARTVDRAAQELLTFANSVSEESRSVTVASENALTNSEAVATAAEQLSSSVREIAGQIVRTTETTRRAVESSQAASGTVRTLTLAVTKISDVTRLISDIASKTNLLALNATIESARAGEAGRGFAVVASEVKTLANLTARSTEDINRQVAEIQSVTAASLAAMNEVSDRIREVDGAATAIAGAIEQQDAATREIARNVVQTSAAVRQVSERIRIVSESAAQSDDRAKGVRKSINEVTENIGELHATLVRVVRTSTDDADRRRSERFKYSGRCEIQNARGEPRSGQWVDISEHGAHIRCEPELALGELGALKISQIAEPIGFVVRAKDENGLRIEFQLSQPQQDAYQRWFWSNVNGDIKRAS
jgi:methyl-accepting chemotaxis protein